MWIRADRSGPGGPRGPRPPLVDQERSGPPWTTLRHFSHARPISPSQPEVPPPSDEPLSDPSSDSEEAMDVGDDGRPAPLLPNPLQPRLSTFPPHDPSTTPETPPPPPASPSQRPLARACHRRPPLKPLGPVPEMIKISRSTSRHRLAPVDILTLLQRNSFGSWDVFLSLFSSLIEGPHVDIVLLQDLPSSKGFLPRFSGFKSFGPTVGRPKVACYVSQRFLQCFSVLLVFFSGMR